MRLFLLVYVRLLVRGSALETVLMTFRENR